MVMKFVIVNIAFILLMLEIDANTIHLSIPDSSKIEAAKFQSELFYDSLKTRAQRHKFTGWLYDMLVSPTKESFNLELQSYEYYRRFSGKTIASITIKPLEVFGPTFEDTSRVTTNKFGKLANKIHTKSSLKAIQRSLWIKTGEQFDPNLLMDNERVLRELPYLKDVRFIVTTRKENEDLVDILLLTKDVFAFGVTGEIDEIDAGSFGIYNQNILGIGHEVSVKMVGHLNKQPYLGLETFYSIKNFKGHIDFTSGYFSTYKRKGYQLIFNKEFLRPRSPWAGGFNYSRYFKSNRVSIYDPVKTDFPLSFRYLDVWYGRNIQVGINESNSRFQMTISGRVRHLNFDDRPLPDPANHQYFSNSNFYLGSISFSERRYIRDRLIYSYGITEDIPKGYLHEFVFGYDDNEFLKRYYSHIYLSSGNLLKYKPFYMYSSLGIGGYFNKENIEQGQIEFNLDFISRLFNVSTTRARQFFNINYILGINRYNIEDVYLKYKVGIRGFESKLAKGKQRLSVNMETTFFQNREFLKFNTAFFSFVDVGIIGSNQKLIFTQDYYAGFGFGLRLRNENLVFKTISIRMALYPNHPADIGSFGFIVEEQRKRKFYSFQPRSPEPLIFD